MLGGAGECLFSGALPLYVKGAPAAAPLGVPTPPLGVHEANILGAVPLGPAPAPQGPQRIEGHVVEVYAGPSAVRLGRRELEVRVRDAGDPLSLLAATIGEEEYAALRREQRLLVDFAQFPYKVLELLQQCAAAAHDERPLFYAALVHAPDERGADLVVCESTSFRQIVHLSLRLRPPPEPVLRRAVADLLRQYQDEIRALRASYVPGAGLGPIPGPAPGPVPGPILGTPGGADAEMADLRRRLGALQEELRRARAPGGPAESPPEPEVPARVGDIHKANDIIRRLQDALADAKARARAAEDALRDARAEAETLRTREAAAAAERDRLARAHEDDERRLRMNDEVIAWQWQRLAALEGAAPDAPVAAAPPGAGAEGERPADRSYRWFTGHVPAAASP